MRTFLYRFGIFATLFVSGCHLSQDAPEPDEQRFHKDLLGVASEYESWGRVDDLMRFAPMLCSAPPGPGAHFSASSDRQTHGEKLYSAFVKDREAYLTLTARASPVGQVIVKESWIPKETTEVKRGDVDYTRFVRTKSGNFYPYASKGGKVYKASERGDLFIMMKLDPSAPGTDAGWVYGIVTADGKTVTTAGKVESCMNCHRDAKHDRLFGVATLGLD